MSEIDAAVAELRIGFEHLVDGLLATLRVLQDENLRLEARLAECRLAAAAPVHAAAPAPAAQAAISGPALVIAHRRHRLVEKPCAGCKQTFLMHPRRQFCEGCFKTNMSVRRSRTAAPDVMGA